MAAAERPRERTEEEEEATPTTGQAPPPPQAPPSPDPPPLPPPHSLPVVRAGGGASANGVIALRQSCPPGTLELVQVLVQSGAPEGWSSARSLLWAPPSTGPQQVAATKGYIEVMRLLLQDGGGWRGVQGAWWVLAEQLCEGAPPRHVGAADSAEEELLLQEPQKEPEAVPPPMAPDPDGAPPPIAGGKHRRIFGGRRGRVKERLRPLPPPPEEAQPPPALPPPTKPRPSAGLYRTGSLGALPPPAPPPPALRRCCSSPRLDAPPPHQDMRELLQQRRRSLIGSSSANHSPVSEPANQDEGCASADPALDPPLSPAPRRAPPPTPHPSRDEPHRKARTRLMRRRPTQGVTLSQLREVEQVIGRSGDGQALEQPIREEERQDQEEEGAGPPQAPDPTFDYWQPLEALRGQRQRLRERLQEAELELSQRRLELERVTQRQERIRERPALLELERFERRALERKAAELEEELKALADLRADNERLKDENAALIRVISRLAK